MGTTTVQRTASMAQPSYGTPEPVLALPPEGTPHVRPWMAARSSSTISRGRCVEKRTAESCIARSRPRGREAPRYLQPRGVERVATRSLGRPRDGSLGQIAACPRSCPGRPPIDPAQQSRFVPGRECRPVMLGYAIVGETRSESERQLRDCQRCALNGGDQLSVARAAVAPIDADGHQRWTTWPGSAARVTDAAVSTMLRTMGGLQSC